MKKQPDLRTITNSKRTCLDYTSAETPAEFLIKIEKILGDLVNGLPEESKITEVLIDTEYGDYSDEKSAYLIIGYSRKETLAEYNERLLFEQRSLEQRKQEYLRLKKEFEG